MRRVAARSLLRTVVLVSVGAAVLSPMPGTARLAAASMAHPVPGSAAGGGLVLAQTGQFGDVAEGAFYSDAVATLAGQGVFAGTECQQGFCPGEAIDRKTMAVWTVRVLDGQDPPATSRTRFDDVDAAGFHVPFIERMAELGVTTGCGDGSGFCPDRTVTRAQMAVFLARAYSLEPGPDPGFGDVASGAWYADDVARLAHSGITSGCGDGTNYCPSQATTRAQMAVFLHQVSHRASAAACDVLRRTTGYVYPGAPAERVDVAVYLVAFDDMEAPSLRLDHVLATAEAQLEALSHGRTDFVFHPRGTVTLSGSAADRAGKTARDFSTGLVGLPTELAHLRGDADVLVAFTSRYRGASTSFARGSYAAVVTFDDTTPPAPGFEESWDTLQHNRTIFTLVHELLHNLGLDDYYDYSSFVHPAVYLTSIMRLENYASAGYSYQGHIDHYPATAWSKWLLGWLDGPEEALCTAVDGPTQVVLRPHQQVTLGGIYYNEGDCHGMTRVIWGPAAARPAFAIVPTSDTTALVIEADPLGGGLLDFPRCGDFHTRRPEYLPNRKAVGDVVVYSVDTTIATGQLPLRVIAPDQSLITEAEYTAYDQYTRRRHQELSSWYQRALGTEYEGEYSAANAYATELVVGGYRITIAERTVADDGLAQVTVAIEPA